MNAPATAPSPETKSPLLPPVLLHPAGFLWLWALPIGVLLLLNLQGYWLVSGNMSPEQRAQAWLLGWCGVGNFITGLALFFGMRWHRRKPAGDVLADVLWGLPSVLVQAGYLWLVVHLVDARMLPDTVTLWIYPPERFLFNQFAFAMLPLFHGILRVACARPAAATGRAVLANLGLAVAAPVLLYFIGCSVSYFRVGHHAWSVYIIATFGVLLGLVMFMGLIRGLLLLFRQAMEWNVRAERAAIVIVGLALPLGGLMLNRSIPFPVDLQAWETYALMTVNFLVLFLASCFGASRPRLSFHLLCATLPYSLYFFVIFLPYTPLSIVAVIVFGAGLLVLTPTFLFTLHLHLLHQAGRRALVATSRVRLVTGALLCALILPEFFTARGLADKLALNDALDYLYAPSVKAGDITYAGNLTNLRRAIHNHRSYKNGIYYPLLSDYYAWLVFDNLVLPDEKLLAMEKTFFGSPVPGAADPFRQKEGWFGGRRSRDRGRVWRSPVPPPQTVKVETTAVRVSASAPGSAVVTLALTLQNSGSLPAEYVTPLRLPAGVVVNGFRLQVGSVLVPGRIFEKKTALWVYEMIRDTERRDPGLLLYRTASELELRVFPVNAGVSTRVEIDLLVPAGDSTLDLAPQAASAADVLAQIDAALRPRLVRDDHGNAMVAGLDALHLPVVRREPYLHLVVDRSGANGFEGDLTKLVTSLKERYPDAKCARVTVANHDVTDLVGELTLIDRLPAFGARELQRVMSSSGELALDLSMAHAIRRHAELDLDRTTSATSLAPRPIFVLVGRHAATRPLKLPLTEAWSDLLPGLEIAEVGEDGSFVSHIATATPALPLLKRGVCQRPLLPGRIARFIDDGKNVPVEYWSPTDGAWRTVEGVSAEDSTPWAKALALQAAQQDHARSPGDAGVDLPGLVKASRASGILLPSTSYIVVENQAQWRILELGEKQKLGQNAALDFVETPAPSALWVALGFAGWLGLRRWRARPHVGNCRASSRS